MFRWVRLSLVEFSCAMAVLLGCVKFCSVKFGSAMAVELCCVGLS